jgi:hypothetical protein
MATKPKQPAPESRFAVEDTTLRCLSKADRKKLGMDAWEPSLLRKLLAAQNRLKARN